MIQTERLLLRRLEPEDAAFILALVNDPDWLRYIGDKNVRTLDEARSYIENGPAAMYAKVGFGLYLTALRSSGVPIGLCGLLKRDTLPDVDIGFALLPEYRNRGLAHEAAAATIAYGRSALDLRRIVAITTPDNVASQKLLRRLGMRDAGRVQLGKDTDPLSLFALDFNDAAKHV